MSSAFLVEWQKHQKRLKDAERESERRSAVARHTYRGAGNDINIQLVLHQKELKDSERESMRRSSSFKHKFRGGKQDIKHQFHRKMHRMKRSSTERRKREHNTIYQKHQKHQKVLQNAKLDDRKNESRTITHDAKNYWQDINGRNADGGNSQHEHLSTMLSVSTALRENERDADNNLPTSSDCDRSLGDTSLIERISRSWKSITSPSHSMGGNDSDDHSLDLEGATLGDQMISWKSITSFSASASWLSMGNDRDQHSLRDKRFSWKPLASFSSFNHPINDIIETNDIETGCASIGSSDNETGSMEIPMMEDEADMKTLIDDDNSLNHDTNRRNANNGRLDPERYHHYDWGEIPSVKDISSGDDHSSIETTDISDGQRQGQTPLSLRGIIYSKDILPSLSNNRKDERLVTFSDGGDQEPKWRNIVGFAEDEDHPLYNWRGLTCNGYKKMNNQFLTESPCVFDIYNEAIECPFNEEHIPNSKYSKSDFYSTIYNDEADDKMILFEDEPEEYHEPFKHFMKQFVHTMGGAALTHVIAFVTKLIRKSKDSEDTRASLQMYDVNGVELMEQLAVESAATGASTAASASSNSATGAAAYMVAKAAGQAAVVAPPTQ